MAEVHRSLAACLRCRRKKLKCGGPSLVPCQRCRASKAECVFVSPRPIHSSAPLPSAGADRHLVDKLVLLEQRLDRMEGRHAAEMQEMREIYEKQRAASSQLASPAQPTSAGSDADGPASQPVATGLDMSMGDIIARGIVSETEWEELYDFFYDNCRSVVGFVDDQIYPPQYLARQHPLMSTVICAIAARAIRPAKYPTYLAEADELIKNTFVGETPDIQAVRAIMLLNAWTGRTRLWGYAASLAAELGLNTAALQLDDETIEHTDSLVQRARTWFTLCCFDLTLNLGRPFVINKMREYLPLASNLLASPYCQPVDHRICAYIAGFTITADAKARFPKAQLQSNPLDQTKIDLLTSFDQSIDQWFYQTDSTIGPQSPTGFSISRAFMKLYINGFALHGIESDSPPDTNRLTFIQKALDSASALIRTQFQSDSFRRRLRYTIDYKGVTTYQAISFILKAIPDTYQYLKCDEAVTALRLAAQMFEEAGAAEAAREVQREQKKMALLTQTVLSPTTTEDSVVCPEMHEHLGVLGGGGEGMFDIPSFLDGAKWDEPFPMLDLFMVD